jgi:uncharacterized protein
MSHAHLTYHQVISQCVQQMRNMEVWLDMAERHATEKKIDVNEFLTARLAPDMKDFIYQIRSASDYVKGAAAWLSGQTPPKFEDNEETIDELRARIEKTVAFCEGVDEARFAQAGAQRVKLSWAPPGTVLIGKDYLLQITLPNVFFHVAMAYAILRNQGVEIGKMDFLGTINFAKA